jgi:hypothetical protein
VPGGAAPSQGGLLIRGRLTGESRTPHEIREAVYLFTGDAGAKQSRFWLLLVLSTVIATTGVIGDSTATVIGAMIIAPLAIPIQGAAVAIAYGELRPLLLSTAVVAGAMVVVVGLCTPSWRSPPGWSSRRSRSRRTGRSSSRTGATRPHGFGSAWAEDNGERLLGVRFDGDALVLIVEDSTDGAGDAELTELLRGEIPTGTPVVVNRVAGRRASIGQVGD